VLEIQDKHVEHLLPSADCELHPRAAARLRRIRYVFDGLFKLTREGNELTPAGGVAGSTFRATHIHTGHLYRDSVRLHFAHRPAALIFITTFDPQNKMITRSRKGKRKRRSNLHLNVSQLVSYRGTPGCVSFGQIDSHSVPLSTLACDFKHASEWIIFPRPRSLHFHNQFELRSALELNSKCLRRVHNIRNAHLSSPVQGCFIARTMFLKQTDLPTNPAVCVIAFATARG